MKRWILVIALLLSMVGAVQLSAATSTVTQDVLRMSQARVTDDSIIAFVQSRRGKVEVSADDIIAMSQAGVSKTVITAIIDESAARRETAQRDERQVYSPYPYYSPRFYGPSLHGLIGFGGYYGGYGGYYGGFGGHYGGYAGHYGGFGFGHHGGWGRGGRH